MSDYILNANGDLNCLVKEFGDDTKIIFFESTRCQRGCSHSNTTRGESALVSVD